MLDPFAQLVQHGATHAHYTWSPKTYGLYPSHDALKEPTLPGVVNKIIIIINFIYIASISLTVH